MTPAYPLLDMTFIRHSLSDVTGESAVGHTIIYHTSVPSTMPIAAELARDPDTPSGTVVVAEEQTSGRGRRGRTWRAPYASALLMSVILKFPHIPFPAAVLGMAAGNALHAAVATLLPGITPELRLKWPNDLIIGTDPTSARKVAGILAESSFAADGRLDYAILGIGINVNQQADDLPRIAPPTPRPTSLRVATGELIDRSYLLVLLCQALTHAFTRSTTENYLQWKAQLNTLGQTVAVYAQGIEEAATLTGQAVDVQDDGALVVVDETGAAHAFHAADVSVRVT